MITSLSLTQRYTRDMFPWSMVTIWGRCRSNNGTVCLFYFINYKESCVLILIDKYPLHLDDARSGEWGDHVTLQAVADAVWIMSTCRRLFFCSWRTLILFSLFLKHFASCLLYLTCIVTIVYLWWNPVPLFAGFTIALLYFKA